jgi:hypothetical protein
VIEKGELPKVIVETQQKEGSEKGTRRKMGIDSVEELSRV